MSSPVYCADEQTQQNHRTRTRPNRLVVSLWGHCSEMARQLGRSPRKVLGYQTPSEVFTAHIMQGVRIET